MKILVAKGTAHTLPTDLRQALINDNTALTKWNSLTPLARNEWICWTISVKQAKTRADHVRQVITRLKAGQRRPCCWIGCIHRTDKKLSPSIKGILNQRKVKN